LPSDADVQRAECPHFDTEERPSTLKKGPGPLGLIWRGDVSGPHEITLHYENGGVVGETKSLTEVVGTLKNAVHQFFR
jgi:hypothetical protein